jgi:hypothetical protein
MAKPKKIDSIIETLTAFRPKGDYLDQLETLCEEIEGLSNGIQAMPSLFAILEKHPKTDFGAPGPIVHLLETYYKKGYEEALLESLARLPVPLTVWMLNRIINGSSGKTKTRYLDVMKGIAADGAVPANVRHDAKEFLNSPDED